MGPVHVSNSSPPSNLHQNSSILNDVLNEGEKEVKPSPSKRSKVEEENIEEMTLKKVKIYENNEETPVDLNEESERGRKKAGGANLPSRLTNIHQMAEDEERLEEQNRKKIFREGYRYEVDTDPDALTRKQKTIDYGKNTLEYKEYIMAVPKESRLPHHPRTPNVKRKYSRRAWDGLIRLWRSQLHLWDKSEEDMAKIQAARRQLSTNNRHNESFSSDTCSTATSTASSVVGENLNGLEETVVEASESSWYDETLEFENEYLELQSSSPTSQL